jgi:hypothetical protein
MTRVVMAVIALMLALPGVAAADVLVDTPVDGPSDGSCSDGDCTLREALASAPAGERIIVPAGDYALLNNLVVPRNLTIVGAGARSTTIRRAIEFPGLVLFIDSLASDVDLSGVRITGGSQPGSPGGGILVESAAGLHLADSIVDGNVADRGGGIYSFGTLEVVRSAIIGNQAVGAETSALGGGIYVGGGTASLENTTVSGNIARDADGIGNGGGIYTAAGLLLRNVTIAENEATDGGGLKQNFAPGEPQTFATSTLVARNVGGNCDSTVTPPIDSTNGVSDDPSCESVGTRNQVVADTRLGPLALNGATTETHALLAGSPAIDKGTAPCPLTDQRGISRPRGAACDVGAYEFVPVPPPPGSPPPPPPEDEELPPPVAGKSANALPKSGKVRVKLPGTNKFVVLDEGDQIPVGTTVDVRNGRVTLVAAGGGRADFYGGIFRLAQTKGAKPLTTLRLVEKLSCKSSGKKASAAAKKKRKRRLWGDGKGRFRTRGKHSAATVVGTKWLVEDRCNSTLTRVARGRVSVRDFAKKKTVTVKAGKKYVARRRS